jgi:hypothetical protein
MPHGRKSRTLLYAASKNSVTDFKCLINGDNYHHTIIIMQEANSATNAAVGDAFSRDK